MSPTNRPYTAPDVSTPLDQQTTIHQRSTSLPIPSCTSPSIPSPPQIQPQRSLPITLNASSQVHKYHPIRHEEPMPQFRDGRDRFPIAERRFWHPTAHLDHHRYERLPGEFSDEDFLQRWRATSRHIDDNGIIDIQPETTYGGIRYRITTHPEVWKNYVILRGDTIIFRGLDVDNLKYFVTWTLNKDHDNKHAYIQVNAFNQFQGNLDSSDADWPALGFLVPKSLCNVLIARPPPMLQCPFDFDPQLAPDLPELHPSPQSQHQRRRAHVWESPLPGLMHFSKLNVLTRCKKFLADNKE